MKLYQIETTAGLPAGWVGTQQEGRDQARSTPGRFVPIDVPTDKPGLIAWLAKRDERLLQLGRLAELISDSVTLTIVAADRVPTDAPEQLPERPPTLASANCPMCARTPRGAELLAQGNDADAISDWIMAAEPFQIRNVMEGLAARLIELTKGARG